MRLPVEVLENEVIRFLVHLGLPSDDAAAASEVLVEAEAEGLSSHGLGRLPIYASQLQAGGLNARPEMRLTRSRPGVAVLEADRALGPVAGLRAVATLETMVRDQGVAVVAVRGAGHVGPLSAYVGRLSRHGLIALAFANTPPAIAPWNGKNSVLGTNPIAFAAPAQPEPLMVDLSLSVAARGKILQAARADISIPAGWAVDSQGVPTTDPDAALEGALLPVGGAKGYALAVMAEVLAGVLAGQVLSLELPFPWLEPDKAAEPGFFLQALDLAAFGSESGYRQRMQTMAEAVRSAGGRLPGERRQENRRQSGADGIEISDSLRQDLSRVGMNLPYPGEDVDVRA